MATEDLVPAYLAEIYNRAIPNPLTDNEPLQGFTAPLDTLTLSDVPAATALRSPASLYGMATYGAAHYQPRSDLTYSGRVITDAYRALLLDGDGLATPGGLGIWEATTNLCTNGGFESSTTGWTQVSAILAQDGSWSMFGSKSGRVETADAQENEGAYITFVASGGVPHTGSAWARVASGSGTVRARIADNTGSTVTAGASVTLSATPQRVTVTTTSSLTNGATYRLYLETDVQQPLTFWIDGVQPEPKSYATPYVATNGAVTTRAAAGVGGIPVSLLNATTGWMAMRLVTGLAATGSGNNEVLINAGGDTNNALQLFYRDSTQKYVFNRFAGGAGNEVDSAAQSFAAGSPFTLISMWDAGHVYIDVSGTGTISTANTTIPTLSGTTDIGYSRFTAKQMNGTARWVALGTGTLTGADISYLNSSSVSTNPPLFSVLSSSASCTGIVLGNVATPILLLAP